MKTHWKNYHNPNYIGAYSFQPNERKVLTIKHATRETVTGPNNREDECLVIHFTEDAKPMICNATNSKAITKVAGSPYVEDWPNVKIELFVSSVKAFGDTVDAVRVKSTAPIIKLPAIGKAQAEEAIKRPDLTREFLSKHYTITDEQWKKIETARKTTK